MRHGAIFTLLLLLCITTASAFTVSHIKLNHELQAVAIDSLVVRLSHNPVLCSHSRQVEHELQIRHQRGDYRDLMDPILFAQRIGKDVTHVLTHQPKRENPLLLFRREFQRYLQREARPSANESESVLVMKDPARF